jgi:exodeoxyribonuclease VII large subunit
MKTPTAVAEFFISGAKSFYDRLTGLEEEVVQLTRETVDSKREQLEDFADNLHHFVGTFINEKNRQLVKTGNNLQQQVSRFSFNKKYELNNLKHDLYAAFSVWKVETRNSIDRQKRILKRVVHESMLKETAGFNRLKELIKHESKRFLLQEQERILRNENTVRLLNPENVLSRGYTLTMKDGKIVKSVSPLQLNDEIETRFADGNVKSKIIKKE